MNPYNQGGGGYSPGGYPTYPGSSPSVYPGTNPSSAPPPGQVMGTSFISSPSGYGGSRTNIYPSADISKMKLLPAGSSAELNTSYLHPLIATFLFPAIGIASLYHTHEARQNLKKGNKVRANYHVQKSNTYYGYSMCVGLAFWMFVLAVVFVIITHALINRRHYSVSQPGKFMNYQ